MSEELKSLTQPKNCEMFISRGVYLEQFSVDRMINDMVGFIKENKPTGTCVSMSGNTIVLAFPPDEGDTLWEIYDCLPRRYGTYDPTRQNNNSDQ